MIDKGGQIRNLTQKERQCMKLIYEITENRRKIMVKIEEQMHKQFDHVFEEIVYKCVHCKKGFKGASIGQHYRINEQCKYMKDRPFLKQLPPNWKEDLKCFFDDENKSGSQ